MTLRTYTPHLLAISLLAAASVPLAAQAVRAKSTARSIDALRQGFLNPPDGAKPMVRWWWFGPAVVKPEILRELRQMKADGIGGAELAFVYPEVLDDPAKNLKNLPFLSPAMLDDLRYAQEQGRRLGLRIDITLCSGWPYGGPDTPLSQAAGRLRTIEVPVAAEATSVSVPRLGEGESFLSAAMVDGHLSATSGPRGRVTPGEPVGWDAKSSQPLMITPGTTAVRVSSTPRVALFFVAGHTKQMVKRAAVGAEGYVLDPFSHEAVATHLAKVGVPLLSAFGSTPPYAIFSDSLEAFGADWTPDLPQQFLKRRGYDLIPHLAELVAGGSPEAEKVRHDWGMTLTELVDENSLIQINDWANAHHTKFRSQTYHESAVDFSSQNLVALTEGEGPQWRAFSTLRWATSANHVFGHEVTSGETYTWLHSPVFRATPLDMKAEGDIDFITGENQLIFHGWPYSPPDHEVPEPGWSLYAATSMNDHNPWHPVMPAVTAYLTRLSWLLRQGQPANQVAILLPTDDAWASFSPSHVSVTDVMKTLIAPELMSTILSAGYNADFIDAAAMDKVGLGTHEILVLPPTDRIPVATLRKIDAYAAHGGKVIAIGKLPSMDAEGAPLPADTALTAPIVLVPSVAQLSHALTDATAPDLRVTEADDETRDAIGFIRRKLPNADVYYLVNTSNKSVGAGVFFGTKFKHAVRWNPETGQPVGKAVSADLASVELAPYESALYIFSDDAAPHSEAEGRTTTVADLSSDWKVDFRGLDKSSEERKLTDWTADPATLHYSGEVDYTREVTLSKLPHGRVSLTVDGGTALPGAPNSQPEQPALGANGLPNPMVTRTGPGMHAYFDPPIHEAALVVVNGTPVGALWHPPYRLDVSKLLKPGRNHIEIRVFNTALNAWSALPPHNYKPLIAKYGDRFQMQDLDKVEPISSGILGTIHLVTQDGQ